MFFFSPLDQFDINGFFFVFIGNLLPWYVYMYKLSWYISFVYFFDMVAGIGIYVLSYGLVIFSMVSKIFVTILFFSGYIKDLALEIAGNPAILLFRMEYFGDQLINMIYMERLSIFNSNEFFFFNSDAILGFEYGLGLVYMLEAFDFVALDFPLRLVEFWSYITPEVLINSSYLNSISDYREIKSAMLGYLLGNTYIASSVTAATPSLVIDNRVTQLTLLLILYSYTTLLVYIFKFFSLNIKRYLLGFSRSLSFSKFRRIWLIILISLIKLVLFISCLFIGIVYIYGYGNAGFIFFLKFSAFTYLEYILYSFLIKFSIFIENFQYLISSTETLLLGNIWDGLDIYGVNVLYFYDLSITNIGLITFFILYMLFKIFYNMSSRYFFLIPNNVQIILESIILFVIQIIYQQLGRKGYVYIPLYLYIFIFILTCNVLSMMPFGFAVTSHMYWVFFLSFSMCLGIFMIGVFKHSWKIVKILLPTVPFVLKFLMFFIEIISYFVKSLSLGIRLSANLIAGHTLVHILFSVLLSLPLVVKNLAFFLSFSLYFILILFLFALLLLEFGVAFLQAYVYILLLTMYLNDIINIDNH